VESAKADAQGRATAAMTASAIPSPRPSLFVVMPSSFVPVTRLLEVIPLDVIR
jgi:hypothetical protein